MGTFEQAQFRCRKIKSTVFTLEQLCVNFRPLTQARKNDQLEKKIIKALFDNGDKFWLLNLFWLASLP